MTDDFHSGTENSSFLNVAPNSEYEVNFALEGLMIFKFRQGDDPLERKVRMRIAQGNYRPTLQKENHPWQIFVMDEVCEDKTYADNLHELRCNKSQLALKALPRKKHGYHEIAVSPYPY